MEAAVLIGLLGIGYALDRNKNDTHKVYDNIKPPQNQPSQNTIYDQSNISDAKKSELQIVNDRIEEANKGSSTMIDSLNMEGRNTLRKDEISTLSGSPINKETFLTNDQGIKVEPFFSGAPPNINYKENRSLSNHQGGNPYDRSKREQSSFFPPQRNIGNVFGRQFSGPDSDKSRYIGGSYRSNELPFEQEKIQQMEYQQKLNQQRKIIESGDYPFKLIMVGIVLGGKPIEEYAPDFWLVSPENGGDPVGFITSPWYHPEKKQNIAMGYVPFDGTLNPNGFPKGKVGTKYKVHLPEKYSDTPGTPVDAVVVEIPFKESFNANTREVVKG